MDGYLSSPLEFLITTLFSLYILVVMLRFLFQLTRADFYNPISQFVVKATNPPLRVLRRIIPGVGGIDFASIVLMLVLQFVSLAVVVLLRGASPGSLGILSLLLWSVEELVKLAFNVFIFSILIQAVLSWVNPGTYNPVNNLLYSLNEPLLRPVRRLIPPMGGLDLSPLAVIIGLQVLKMLVIPPLMHLAAL